MERGAAQNGVRSNLNRNLKANGINGLGSTKRDPSPNTARAAETPRINGPYDPLVDVDTPTQAQASSNAADQDPTMNNLPPEIAHITQNFVGLPLILQRLAQKSHNDLQAKVEELAKIPIPQDVINGNAGTAEDNSEENQNKKANLLNFIQDMHSKWVKALVISEWSRAAGHVSKLIDLNVHINEQLGKYDGGLDFMGHIKRGLYGARLPDPDLKTALQVLSTGQAPWMPEFGYIDPPPLTPAEQMKWINELTTLLSIRLNLIDHEKIPYHFREYKIDSGRVTFKVQGEFEVDLTIGDEDLEKQFWFLDFRFTFSPAPHDLAEALRACMEIKVNEALASDGLQGCYDFLHELTLTHKINELRRQAVWLSRGRWIDEIKVERLNRALSIQYWVNRLPAAGPNTGSKSWIIIGVNSGKTPPPNAPPGTKPKSHLSLRWFRDEKEVSHVNVPVDSEAISAETLLKKIIAKHVEHILSSIYDRLLSKPRFEKRQASMSLKIDSEEPSESTLVVQLTHSQSLTVGINLTTGYFNMRPAAQLLISKAEAFLNQRCRNAIEDGTVQIENIRWQSEFGELIRLGDGHGWHVCRRPVSADDVRRLHPSREPYNALWLKREGWGPAWYLVVCLSLAGDRWWLVEVADDELDKGKVTAPISRNRSVGYQAKANANAHARVSTMLEQSPGRIKTHNLIPITSANPEFSVAFFGDLTALSTGMIAQITDIMTLRKKKIQYVAKRANNPYLSPRLKIPALFVRISAILPPKRGDKQTRQAGDEWAENMVQIVFRGVCGPASSSPSPAPGERLCVSADAKVVVKDKSRFALIRGNVDHDVFYDGQTGQFRLHLKTEIGTSFIDPLTTRLKAIDRLVEFLAAINRRANQIQCESVTLRKVVFTYGNPGTFSPATNRQTPWQWRVILDLASSEKVSISLGKGNPHIRVHDMLDRLVNSPAGFEQLPFWLQLSLPLQKALDSVEKAWLDTTDKQQGSIEVLPQTLDWVHVHVDLPHATGQALRHLCLSIRARPRRGQLWWHVTRCHVPTEAANQDDDEFDRTLQPVFDARGDGWQGHGKSAVALCNGNGIEDLLAKTSDALRALAIGVSGPAPAASQGAATLLN